MALVARWRRKARWGLVPLGVAFALAGCRFEPRIPADAKLLCADRARCPAGLACRSDTGQCVAAGISCLVYQEAEALAAPAPDGSVCATGICVQGRCVAPTCGDGIRSGDEQCDDGNDVDHDACRNDCRVATCGDGVLYEEQERCDDGNTADDDACLRTCVPNVCGDGFLNPAAEECDDGNASDEDGCRTDCLRNRCGDGFIDPQNEACDDGNEINDDNCRNDCQLATCGDGVVWVGMEECDDGNLSNEDDCLTTCRKNRCGDGFLNPGTEGCDDGNEDNQDDCLAYCVPNVCGDGLLNVTRENCDDGNLDASDACKDDCTPNQCGDGVLLVGVEACDDGNTESGDGCRRDCGKIERCGDGELDQGEACDDGNQNELDLCRHCQQVSWQPEVLAGFGEGSADATATDLTPLALGVDPEGNVLIASRHDNYIYRYDAQYRKITRFAGTGTLGDFGDGTRRAAHQVNAIGVVDLTVDGRGRVLVVDVDESIVRQIDGRTGEVIRLAGNGEHGYSGDGLPATMASLNVPEGAVADGLGNVFIADAHNHRIRRVDHRTGIITTVAGTGAAGFSGDGGDPRLAALHTPRTPRFAPDGSLYFVDRENDRIRRLVPAANDRYQFARIETVAGNGQPYDPAETGLDRGIGVAGNLNGFDVTPDGQTLYFTVEDTFALFAIDLVAQDIEVVAGSLGARAFVDDVPAQQARFGQLDKIAVDGPHRIYVADIDNARVRLVERSHAEAPFHVRTVAGRDFVAPSDVVFVAYLLQVSDLRVFPAPRVDCEDQPYRGDLYMINASYHRIYRRDCAGLVRGIGGTGTAGFSGDGGDAARARFSSPSGAIPMPDRSLFVADLGNHRIRRILPDGTVETYAGTGAAGFSGDGGDARDAQLNRPSDVAVDDQGRLLVIDSGNHRIRRIDPTTRTITTVVGTGVQASGDDGTDPHTRALNQPLHGVYVPASLLLDGAGGGLLVFSERGGHRIRVWMDLTLPNAPFPIPSRLFTLAGDGTEGYGDDPDGLRARFSYPRSLSIHSGSPCADLCMLVTDGYDRVRMLDLVPQPQNFNRPLAASVSTLLGGTAPVHDGSFETARIQGPTALVQLPGDRALFTERYTGRLRRLDLATESVVTLAGLPSGTPVTDQPVPLNRAPPLAEPADMALDTGANPQVLYIAEQAGHTLRQVTLHKIDDPSTWTTRRYLGRPGVAGHRDGAHHEALFDGPSGLAIDPEARLLLVAEAGNQTLRRIDLRTGTVATLAGTPGLIGSFGDDTPAADALFFQPSGLALTENTERGGLRSLYVADTGNHRIRRIDGVFGDAPTIHTILGDGAPASSGEGGPARFFPVHAPAGIALDENGNLYTTSSNAIRMLLAEDDGRSDATDAVASIYGSAPRNIFPEPITTCLRDLQLGSDHQTLYAVDECLGVVLRLRQQDSAAAP